MSLLQLDIILYVMGELANMKEILLDCISHVFLTIFIPQEFQTKSNCTGIRLNVKQSKETSDTCTLICCDLRE